MNSYLKELADICGIRKHLSTHTARHTFATLTLASGATIENVAKMLGHSDTKMTRHYAPDSRFVDSAGHADRRQKHGLISRRPNAPCEICGDLSGRKGATKNKLQAQSRRKDPSPTDQPLRACGFSRKAIAY